MNYRQKAEFFFQKFLDALYPIRCGKISEQICSLPKIHKILEDVLKCNVEDMEADHISKVLEAFEAYIPELKSVLDEDVEAIYQGDPAAKNHNEIIVTYPGFFAVAAYRVAHFLAVQGVPLIPRIITEYAHTISGVDIHPEAKIGKALCIDHGTGVVIGQTAEIGNHVKIYQGVTLGALSIPKTKSTVKRHPTIEDGVVIYAHATILGGDTTIGAGSVVGGNVWLTHSVPPNTKVVFKENANVLVQQNILIKG